MLLCVNLSAQSEHSFFKKVNTSVLLGYQVGGQGENRNFVTKNGASVQLNLLYQINKFISSGPGIGIVNLESERYVPIFLGLKAKLKESRNSKYIKARLGYSLAQNEDISQFDNYAFDGGIYFTAGYGYQWGINERLLLNFEINVEFQEAGLEFQSFSGESFKDDIQNYFLSFKSGISF